MASSKEYLEFILGQLYELEEVSYRAMMGEFILYYKGKIVGGIYDDRLLVKPVKSAISYMPNAVHGLPYKEQKRCYLLMMLTTRITWLAYLMPCMMNCQIQNPKRINRTTSICRIDFYYNIWHYLFPYEQNPVFKLSLVKMKRVLRKVKKKNLSMDKSYITFS